MKSPTACYKWIYPTILACLAGLAAAIVDNNYAVGNQLRIYRLAVATTGEFTAYHGSKANAYAAVDGIINELNKVYERELSIRLELISEADSMDILFDGALTDPYSGSRRDRLTQNQAVLDDKIGVSNYDVGHVFHRVTTPGGGGVANLGVVGKAGSKGGGSSEAFDPSIGDVSFLDILLHEFGHQFGAQHTFNANANGSCLGSGSNAPRSDTNAYEPASGSTLMSYAGICGSDNLQSNGDTYFHAASFEQINEYIANNAHAQPYATVATSNMAPTVNGGNDYTIPANTPFELTASGVDADGDPLTYTWEQLDLGPAMSLPLSDNGSSPLFRSFPPTSDPTRTFPRLSDLLADTIDPGEVLPTSNRALNFRVTVRDNQPGGGGLNSNDVLLQVVNTGSAFALTSPNGGEAWTGGASQTVTWNVAGTNANGIDTAQVDILLSTDGGETFPHHLLTTSNDGSEMITIPNINTSRARLKVRGHGNVFFDLSNNDFAITSNPNVPGITITLGGGGSNKVISEAGFVEVYEINLNTAPAGELVVTASVEAEAEVSTDGITYGPSADITLSSTAKVPLYVRALDDLVLEGGHVGIVCHSIVYTSSVDYPLNTVINKAVFSIEDDDVRPVYGIDFDYITDGVNLTGALTQENWIGLQVDEGVERFTDLIRDDGVASIIDFEFRLLSGGSLRWSTAGADSTTIPNHTPALKDVIGYNSFPVSIRATWSDLTPGRRYNVYVFGLDPDPDSDFGQEVSIAGATILPSFTQTLPEGLLEVNEETGSSDALLESFAKTIAADAGGEIKVTLTPLGDGLGIAAMALSEADILPVEIVATDASAAEPLDNASFQVSLPAGNVAPTGGLEIDYAIGGSATNGMDFASLTGSATIAAGSQTTVIDLVTQDDTVNELPENVIITLAKTSNPWMVLAPTRVATATMASDEATDLQLWTQASFPLVDILDPTKEASLWGLQANPDGDALINLEEYFYSTPPEAMNEYPISSETVEFANVNYLDLTFTRRKGISGLTQQLEQAPSPAGTWNPASGTTETATDLDADREKVTVRYPLGLDTRRFLRLRLEEHGS